MMNHTGRIIFTCPKCEFEFTKQSMLEDHMVKKHKKEVPWWHDDKPTIHDCERCEKTFPNIFLKKYHKCIPQSKYACEVCEFRSTTLDEHLTHLEQVHSKKPKSCSYCAFTAKDEIVLRNHIVTMHEDSAIITIV